MLLGLLGSAAAAFGEVSIGDTHNEVLAELGEPTGFIETNGKEAYSFDRGHVIFRDGRVVSHTIVSEEEAQERRETAERQRQERLEEGLALRDRMHDNEELAAKPARDRLAFWEVFRQKYPDVDVSFEHSVAARQVKAEEQDAMRERETRLAEAEKMAELAREQQAQVYDPYVRSGFPLVFGDPFSTDRKPIDKDKTKVVPPFQVRQPAPLPPTPREQAMPLQSPESLGQPGFQQRGFHQRDFQHRGFQQRSHFHQGKR